MTTYRLRNLDCALCAQGIEEGLRGVEGVRSVSVDFGTLSMKVEATDLDVVEAAVRRIEPEVSLERIAASGRSTGTDTRSSFGLKRELLTLCLAATIAAAGLVLGPRSIASGAALGLLSWIEPAFFAAAYVIVGWKVLAGAARNILRGRVFDELFLMSVATLGAFVIGRYEEALGVMAFYKIGEMLEESASGKSRASVAALLDLRPDFARLRRDGAWALRSPGEAVVGDEYQVLPGERLALDGMVAEGESFVDTSALTGESMPRRARPGDEVLAGFLAVDGSLVVRTSRPAGESSAARIAGLVENAAHAKARTERFISRFAAVYTPIVVGMAAVVALLPPFLIPGQSLRDWVYRALVMLVISCPCALVVSVPLGYFGGIGGAARRGILVKGSQVLESLARVQTVVFDKTGTLTEGIFRVLEIRPAVAGKEEELLALAAAAESLSRHPIAASIRAAAAERGLSTGTDDEASELREAPGAGVVARVGRREVLAGNDRLLHIEGISHSSCESEGTTVHVAVDGVYAGRITVGDNPKADALAAVRGLADLGIGRTAMLTGDAACSALPVAAALGIREAYAELLPEDKLDRLTRIIQETAAGGGTTVFVGDGINDAPVLARADVGVAMGAGSDAAVESADMVLMTDEPSRLVEAVIRAKRIRRIVTQNIAFALGVKAAFLGLGALGIAVMWEAVIADMGVALLAIANSLRAMR